MSNIVNYQKLMHTAMCGVMKDALGILAKTGNSNNVHIAISFLTDHKGVVIPDHVKDSYPYEITVVLQHQFRDLQIFDNHISVILSFRGKEETIVITYNSIIKYIDIEQGFALDLGQYANDTEDDEDDTEEDNKKEPSAK
ncbi:MAG: ClpXP protease specificity-enhancing factor SspB [Ehrlichia sp.]